MTNRALFLAVGAAWGVLLGGLAGWAIPAFAVFAGIMAFTLCVAAGWVYGGRVCSHAVDRRRTQRTGFGLLGLWAVTGAAIVAISLIGFERQVAGPEQGKAREATFASLSAANHTIDRIDFFGWNADWGSAGIVMRGSRNGDYRISWQVTESTHGQVLAEGRKTVALGPGRRTMVIGFERGVLSAAYREKVHGATGGTGGTGVVEIDETLRFAATVEPVLSPEERVAMPPREVQNLELGQSTLRSSDGVDVPLSFQLPAAPTTQTD